MSKPNNSRGSQRKDEAMYLGMFILGMGLFQSSMTMKRHIDDCSKKSALVAKILIGVAIMVCAELIMKGFSLFQLVSSTHAAN